MPKESSSLGVTGFFATAKRSACDRCRKSKLRCPPRDDNEQPCARCQRAGVECYTGYTQPLGRLCKNRPGKSPEPSMPHASAFWDTEGHGTLPMSSARPQSRSNTEIEGTVELPMMPTIISPGSCYWQENGFDAWSHLMDDFLVSDAADQLQGDCTDTTPPSPDVDMPMKPATSNECQMSLRGSDSARSQRSTPLVCGEQTPDEGRHDLADTTPDKAIHAPTQPAHASRKRQQDRLRLELEELAIRREEISIRKRLLDLDQEAEHVMLP